MERPDRQKRHKIYAGIIMLILTACAVLFLLDDGQAEYEKGLAAYATEDWKTATGYFMIAAEKDHPHAQFMLAQCFFNGKGVHANLSRWSEWRIKAGKTFRKKAESGDPDAMYHLGVILYNHNPRNTPGFEEGRDWIKKAADGGNAQAQELLNLLPRIDALQDAAENGDADAMFELAEAYCAGLTGEDMSHSAVWLFRDAADLGRTDVVPHLEEISRVRQGSNAGTVVLGKLAENGNKDAVRALIAVAEAGNLSAAMELTEPVQQGNRDAMDALVRLAEKGRSDATRILYWLTCVDRNEEAMDTLIRLAEQGDANALDELERAVRTTRLTSNVVDVEWVEETAARTLLRLADAGNKDAARIVRELEKKSTEPTKELLKRLKQNP